MVTEAGFGADLGAEKFFDIKCRKAGLKPAAAVIVATIRSLKMHGGVAKAELGTEDLAALRPGCENLGRHMENVRVRRASHRRHQPFAHDTPAEVEAVQASPRRAWKRSSAATGPMAAAGAEDLARAVVEPWTSGEARSRRSIPDDLCRSWTRSRLSRARSTAPTGVVADKAVHAKLSRWQKAGFGHLPVCMAKTQYSFSTDPTRLGAPTGFEVQVREVRLPPAPASSSPSAATSSPCRASRAIPAAEAIGVDADGQMTGLF